VQVRSLPGASASADYLFFFTFAGFLHRPAASSKTRWQGCAALYLFPLPGPFSPISAAAARKEKKKLPNTNIEIGRGRSSKNAMHSGIAIVWGKISLIAEAQWARTMRNLGGIVCHGGRTMMLMIITDRPIASFPVVTLGPGHGAARISSTLSASWGRESRTQPIKEKHSFRAPGWLSEPERLCANFSESIIICGV
jgi:hypothetical protein